jgi:hypothetical protein
MGRPRAGRASPAGRLTRTLPETCLLALFSALLAACTSRIYTSPHLHVGVRPAALRDTDTPKGAAGFTLQVSTDKLP